MSDPTSGHAFSRVMAGLVGAIIVISPAAMLLAWLNFDYVEPYMRMQMGIPASTTITLEAKFLAAIVTFLRLSIGLLGLVFLRRMFLEGAQGRYFSEMSVSSFRHFSWAALAYVVAAPIERTLVILVFTLGNPEGERMFSVSVGTPDLHALFLGLLLVAVAHMFDHGRKLAPEPGPEPEPKPKPKPKNESAP